MSGSEPITRKRWRPRLWQLIVGAFVFLLLAILVALLAVRANGRARWFAFVAAEQAAGRPITYDYFTTQTLPLDQATQAAWEHWSTGFHRTPTAGAKSSSSRSSTSQNLTAALAKQRAAWDAWVTGHGPLPEAVSTLIADAEKDVAPGLAVLRSGKLLLSRFGWANERRATSGSHGHLPFIHTLRCPDGVIEPLLAEWLHHRAVLGDDPTRSLADLDALQAALARPAILQDAHVAVTVALIRDRTYLALAIRDRLPATARERWLAEPSRAVELAGAGLVGERISTPNDIATLIDHGLARFLDTHIGNWWSWRSPGQCTMLAWIWVTGWDSLPLVATFAGRAAASLRGEAAATFPDMNRLKADLPWFGRYNLAQRLEFTLSRTLVPAIRQEAGHRQAQLAVRILALDRSGGLPADQAELLARLGNDAQDLLSARNRLTLRYERPAPDRLRLVVDPSSPVPDCDDPRNLPTYSKAAGTPPSTAPLTTEPFIEIQLAPTP